MTEQITYSFQCCYPHDVENYLMMGWQLDGYLMVHGTELAIVYMILEE